MFLPLFIAAGLALIGYAIGTGRKDPLRIGPGPIPQVVGYQPPVARRPAPPSYLQVLVAMVNRHERPDMPLMEAAYSEAKLIGDVQACELIEWLAIQLTQPVTGPIDPTPAQDPEAPADAGGEQETEAEVTKQEATVLAPPIPGLCQPPEWEAFVSAMRTRKPQWSSDKYHGAFEHNKSRLKQLGHEPDALVDYDNQYKAFCDDVLAYHKDNNGLIEEFVGDVVDIGGQKVPVTTSGVLGLLKAAGHMGARSWLSNPADRVKYPRTTEAFIRCNTCF